MFLSFYHRFILFYGKTCLNAFKRLEKIPTGLLLFYGRPFPIISSENKKGSPAGTSSKTHMENVFIIRTADSIG